MGMHWGDATLQARGGRQEPECALFRFPVVRVDVFVRTGGSGLLALGRKAEQPEREYSCRAFGSPRCEGAAQSGKDGSWNYWGLWSRWLSK